MIDVHVPQKSEHTWTDFFIHIGTIAVGLLLAIGLEQSVEAIHHAHERRELRAALYTESAQVAKDSRDTRRAIDVSRLVTSVRIAQLRALRDKRPAPRFPQYAAPNSDEPTDPIWQAAKTSDSAALLSREELTGYGELNGDCDLTDKGMADEYVASRAAEVYASRFDGNAFNADLSHASRDEIQEMIERLENFNEVQATTAQDSSATEGAAEAIHNGQYDITKLYAAERSTAKRDEAAFAPRLASALAAPSSSTQHEGSRR